jgi:UDP-2,3-diacylglucosamine pyrophosphatase LpxH
MMSLHCDLLSMLDGVADVSLVARLRDPRLGFPGEARLNVFLPDIHLVTPRRQYRFGTNSPELLTAVVRGLRDFRAAAAGEVVVYQLGDLLDLWRETGGLDPDEDVASAIEDAHPELMDAFYDPALDVQFVLGNHDYDLYRWTNYDVWQRRFQVGPTVLALHGDVLDCVEKLPDRAQNLLVHLLSPGANPCRFPIGALARPSAIAADRFNVQDSTSPPEMLRFLDSARELGPGLTAVVIGHTHHARIAVHENDGGLFALVDCGAWIENCATADDPAPRPNAQLGVLGDDEIRIYQLAPRRKL